MTLLLTLRALFHGRLSQDDRTRLEMLRDLKYAAPYIAPIRPGTVARPRWRVVERRKVA